MNCCHPGRRVSHAAMVSRMTTYRGSSASSVTSSEAVLWNATSRPPAAPCGHGRPHASFPSGRLAAWHFRRDLDPAAAMYGGRAGDLAPFGDPFAWNALPRTPRPAAIIIFGGPGPSWKLLSAVGIIVRSGKFANIAGAVRDFASRSSMRRRGSPAPCAVPWCKLAILNALVVAGALWVHCRRRFLVRSAESRKWGTAW